MEQRDTVGGTHYVLKALSLADPSSVLYVCALVCTLKACRGEGVPTGEYPRVSENQSKTQGYLDRGTDL